MFRFLHRASGMRSAVTASVLLLASSAAFLPKASAQTYTSTDLGLAGTGTSFIASKILNDGWIAGHGDYVTGIPYGPGSAGLMRNPNNVTKKFTVASTQTAFPNIHDGRSMNTSRSIVGVRLPSGGPWPSNSYIWKWNGTTNVDGTLNGAESAIPLFVNIWVSQANGYYDGVNSQPFDINDSGIVVGEATYPSWVQQPSPHVDQGIVSRAFAWDSTASPVPALVSLGAIVDAFPLDPDVSQAYAINNNGKIAGASSGHLFMTTIAHSNPQYDLGDLQYNLGPSYNNAITKNPRPVDISEGNTLLTGTPVQIAGWFSSSDGRRDAFVWTQTSGATGTVQYLPAVRSSIYDRVEARGINNKGQVVGVTSASTNASLMYGWVWNTNTGVVTVLSVEEAKSINDSGVIVGTIRNVLDSQGRSGTHSYLLTPVP